MKFEFTFGEVRVLIRHAAMKYAFEEIRFVRPGQTTSIRLRAKRDANAWAGIIRKLGREPLPIDRAATVKRSAGGGEQADFAGADKEVRRVVNAILAQPVRTNDKGPLSARIPSSGPFVDSFDRPAQSGRAIRRSR